MKDATSCVARCTAAKEASHSHPDVVNGYGTNPITLTSDPCSDAGTPGQEQPHVRRHPGVRRRNPRTMVGCRRMGHGRGLLPWIDPPGEALVVGEDGIATFTAPVAQHRGLTFLEGEADGSPVLLWVVPVEERIDDAFVNLVVVSGCNNPCLLTAPAG